MIPVSQPKKITPLMGLGIFFFPAIAVWFLMRDGYSQRARTVTFGWLGFILIAVSFGIIASGGKQVPTSDAASANANSQPRPTINAAEFNELPNGESYEFVSQYFGPGELIASSDVGDINTASYKWSNPDGSDMILMFQNDRLTTKAQAGLQ